VTLLFYHDTATTEIYTLSLHDALPILGKASNVENVHLPEEFHGYDENKRKAVYPFLAKHFKMDLSKAIKSDGSLNEDMVVIEEQKALYPFDENNPFPAHGIKHNDGVKWK